MAPSVVDETQMSDAGGDSELVLPQPMEESKGTYEYHRWEQIEGLYFPKLEPEILAWIFLSKGAGNSYRQLFKRARIVSGTPESDGRILVRYPLGSTYRVRRRMLMPVLENHQKIVIVASETTDYRRMSIVHCTEQDNFLEIGCDHGVTTASVQARRAIGVDKSTESISIAREKYPDVEFILGDVFEDDLGIEDLDSLVVAMDINGNRDIRDVLRCLSLILNKWSPRLVIVKSRQLYAQMVAKGII